MTTTLTNTTKARAASKATLFRPSVLHFEHIVTERWVKITAKILAEHAAVFEKFDDPAMSIALIFNSYATSVHIYVDYYRRHGKKSLAWYEIRTDAARAHARGKKLTEISFVVREWKWKQFQSDCDTLKDYTPAEVIRGAFAARATNAGMIGHRRSSLANA
ncbi:MAG: hypothetical protein Q8Q59_07760 [Luteolibacter sp.]|nr:hypothetical protein [Luteolibacter sp.]